jgi:hypothetical protein
MYPLIIIWNNSNNGYCLNNYYGTAIDFLDIFDKVLSEFKKILDDMKEYSNEEMSWSDFCLDIQGDGEDLDYKIKYYDDGWKDYQLNENLLKIKLGFN